MRPLHAAGPCWHPCCRRPRPIQGFQARRAARTVSRTLSPGCSWGSVRGGSSMPPDHRGRGVDPSSSSVRPPTAPAVGRLALLRFSVTAVVAYRPPGYPATGKCACCPDCPERSSKPYFGHEQRDLEDVDRVRRIPAIERCIGPDVGQRDIRDVEFADDQAREFGFQFVHHSRGCGLHARASDAARAAPWRVAEAKAAEASRGSAFVVNATKLGNIPLGKRTFVTTLSVPPETTSRRWSSRGPPVFAAGPGRRRSGPHMLSAVMSVVNRFPRLPCAPAPRRAPPHAARHRTGLPAA